MVKQEEGKFDCSQNSTCTESIWQVKARPPDHQAPHPAGEGEAVEEGPEQEESKGGPAAFTQQGNANPQSVVRTLFSNPSMQSRKSHDTVF